MKEENEVVKNVEEEVADRKTVYEKAVEEGASEPVKEEGAAELVEKVESYAEETAETIEEAVEAVEEKAEEIAENVEETVAEMDAEVDEHIDTMKKHDAAKILVQKAKIIVKDAEDQLEECKLLLASDLEDYEKAKQELKENGLSESEILLEQLGYKAEEEENSDSTEDTVIFEPKEELEPIVIEDVSSGSFTGILLALIAGFMTLAGMIYLATEKTAMTLDVSKVPTVETMNPVMQWYASLIGMESNPMAGGAMIVVAVLLVMWIVYKIRVSLKASSNLQMAKAQLEAAEEYTRQKGTCKEEMDKVDAYIHDAIKTLKTYEVVLHEQKAKLERILHIEHDKIENADFHHKSNMEMKDTSELIHAIKDFMSVPMSEEGKLSGKSSLFLHRAKSKVQKVLDRFY